MRQARDPEEIRHSTPTTVGLAVGEKLAYLTPLGTLICEEAISPICPLGPLVSKLGCRVAWSDRGCSITHPIRGKLPVSLIGNCPTVDADLCLELIKDLERHGEELLRRGARLQAIQMGYEGEWTVENSKGLWGNDHELTQWLRKLSPDGPSALLAKAVPSAIDSVVSSHAVPLNRRTRRRLSKASGIVLHLCSGKTQPKEFGNLPSEWEVLSIDVLDGLDLLNEAMYAYLAELCASGKVKAVIAGPPCRTFSRLRERSVVNGSPKPLRARAGVERFGCKDLENDERHCVDKETIIIYRTFTLHHIADEATPGGCMFGLEGPSDPHSYLPRERQNPESCSLFAWPEVQSMLDHGFMFVQFDQGAVGTVKRKPTTILTNSWELHKALHNLKMSFREESAAQNAPKAEPPRGHNNPKVESSAAQPAIELTSRQSCSSLQPRIEGSGSRAKWAPGLCTAMGDAIRAWAKPPEVRALSQAIDHAAIKRLAKDEKEFKHHCETDHVIFRKDCITCLEGALKGHRHARQKHLFANALTLTLDLAGPFKPGEDHEHTKPCKYLLVASLGVPLYKDGRPEPLGDARDPPIPDVLEEDDQEPHGFSVGEIHPDVDDAQGHDSDIEELEECERDRDAPRSDDAFRKAKDKGEAKWKEICRELRAPVKIHNLIFAEPVCSKRGGEVLRAVQKIYTQIRLLSLAVRRVHSDKGREFCNSALESWAEARDIAVTYSAPEDPRSNGRAEAIVGLAKNGIRAILRSCPTLPKGCWPHAARQWQSQRFEASIKILGGYPRKRPIVPFGTQVVCKKREWHRRNEAFDSKAVSGVAVCPASRVSGATIVRIEHSKPNGSKHVQFYTAPVVYTEVREPVQFVGEEVDDDDPAPPPPPLRIRGKTSVSRVVREAENDFGGESGHFSTADSRPHQTHIGAHIQQNQPQTEPKHDHDPDVSCFCCCDGHVHVSSCQANMFSCKLCESVEQLRHDGACPSCGTFQSHVSVDRVECASKLSVAESEYRAGQLLCKTKLDRRELDDLIRDSMFGCSKPKSRTIDRKQSNAKFWTFGSRAFNIEQGVTNETKRRPNLVKLLNRYLKASGSQGTWTSIRVTENFSCGVHRDRNAVGSQNILAPISWYKRGKLWVEDAGADVSKPDTQLREYKGKQIKGRLIGGCNQSLWFDPSRLHAVDESEDDRRVAVGYTTRCLENMSADDRGFLEKLDFPLPSLHQYKQAKIRAAVDDDDTEPRSNARDDPQGPVLYDPILDEVEGDVVRHRMLRLMISENQAFLEEELSFGASGRLASLVTSEHLQQLHDIADAEEQSVLLERSEHALVHSRVSEVRHVAEARVAQLRGPGEQAEPATTEIPLNPDPEEHYPDEVAAWISGGRQLVGQKPKDPNTAPAHPLQTVQVSPLEVLKNLEAWKPSIQEELSSVFEVNQALKRRTTEEVQKWQEEGRVVEYIPGKVLFSKKAGSGRLKTRVLACGNYCPEAKSKDKSRRQTLYAGGIDTLSLRCQLRHCGLRACHEVEPWTAGVVDIRTAFLTAPLDQLKRTLIIRPPNSLIRAGVVAPNEVWEATGAIYGLEESPAAWSAFRDSRIPKLVITHAGEKYGLKQSRSEPNVWLLHRVDNDGHFVGKIEGVLGVYVDDLLCTGPKPLIKSVFAAIATEWRISQPTFADEPEGITFCGLEVRHKGGALRISQQAYIKALLERYPDVTGVASTPYAKEPESVAIGDNEPSPALDQVRLAQKLVGELLWLSTRSRADLCFAVSRLGQLLLKHVAYVIEAAKTILKYLRATLSHELVYGAVGDSSAPLAVDRTRNLVEVHADASFAPGVEKSQTGVVVVWAGCPLGWLSARQPTISLSTTEAELVATVDGLTLAQSMIPIVRELLQEPIKTVAYSDNAGCVALLAQPQGCWRTRHLRLRAKWCLERLELQDFAIHHVPGKYMLGDLCTKALLGCRVRELLGMMSVSVDAQCFEKHGGEPVEDPSADLVQAHSVGNSRTAGSGGACAVNRASVYQNTAIQALTTAVILREAAARRVTVEVVDDGLNLSSADLKQLLIMFVVVGLTAFAMWAWWTNQVPKVSTLRLSSISRGSSHESLEEWSVVESSASSTRGGGDDTELLSRECPVSSLQPEPQLRRRTKLAKQQLPQETFTRETHPETACTDEVVVARFFDDVALAGPEHALRDPEKVISRTALSSASAEVGVVSVPRRTATMSTLNSFSSVRASPTTTISAESLSRKGDDAAVFTSATEAAATSSSTSRRPVRVQAHPTWPSTDLSEDAVFSSMGRLGVSSAPAYPKVRASRQLASRP